MPTLSTRLGLSTKQIPDTTAVAAPVAPPSEADTMASHMAKYGQGGWRCVANEAERLAITDERKEQDMIVVDKDTRQRWCLSPTDTWEAFSGAGGAAEIILDDSTGGGVVSHMAGWQSDPSTGAEDLIAREPNDFRQDIGAQVLARTTVASLRQLTAQYRFRDHESIATSGYWTPGDGGGNLYQYDSTDTSTSDNNGSVIVDLAGRRWKQTLGSFFNVKQWGAKGDGLVTTDDTVAIQSAINAAVGKATVFIPPGVYRTTALIKMKTQVSISGAERQSILRIDHAGDGIGGDGVAQIGYANLANIMILPGSLRTDARSGVCLCWMQDCSFTNVHVARNSATEAFQYGWLSQAPDAGKYSTRNRFNRIIAYCGDGPGKYPFYGEGFVGGDLFGPSNYTILNSYFSGGATANRIPAGIYVQQCRAFVVMGSQIQGWMDSGIVLGPAATGCSLIANRVENSGGASSIVTTVAGNTCIGNDLGLSLLPANNTTTLDNNPLQMQRIGYNLTFGKSSIPTASGWAMGLHSYAINTTVTAGEKIGYLSACIDGAINRRAGFYLDDSVPELVFLNSYSGGTAYPFRWQIAADTCLQVDRSAGAGETRLLLWDVDTGVLKRVFAGPDDSAGSGYRDLRIGNKLGAPTAPGAAPGPAAGQITVTWTAPTVGTPTTYAVLFSATTGGPYTIAPSGGSIPVGTTSFVHSSLTASQTYYYVVTATNPAGTSARSTQVSSVPM